MAAHLHGLGARLGLCARRTPADPGGKAVVAAVDVVDAAAVLAFADEVVDRLGPIDLWVNNAGVLEPIVPLRDADPADVARHVAVNVVGVANGTIAYLRHRHARGGGGALVNVTSGAAATVYQGWAAYGASKAAVDQLSRVVAAEEAASGVRVLAIAPGLVDTDMQALIRATDPAAFPAVRRFPAAAGTDGFNSPAWVTDHVLRLALGDETPADVVLRVPPQTA